MLEIPKIARLRNQLGLTQKELAKISGVSQSLIAKIESNKIDPAYTKVVQILSALESLNKKDKKTAAQIMSSPIFSIQPSEKLDRAIALMEKNELSQIPVFSQDLCIGSILDSTIVSLISKHHNKNLKELLVGEVMEESFPVVPSNSSTDAVADLLKYYRAVLVEQGGKVLGIITKVDLFKAI